MTDMQKDKKAKKDSTEVPGIQNTIHVRPLKGSPIREMIRQIKEVNPGMSENEMINECLSRFLPEILNEEKDKLVRRVEELTGKKLK